MIASALLIVALQLASDPPVLRSATGEQIAIPLSNPGTWISSDDYPPEALTQEAAGRVTVGFQVDREGLIRNCRVSETSGSSSLDEATCRLVTERGRYQPAQDNEGAAKESSVRLSISWVIPEPRLSKREAWEWSMDITLAADGSIERCVSDGFHPYGMTDACEQARGYTNVVRNRHFPGGGSQRRLMIAAARRFDRASISLPPIARAELVTRGIGRFDVREDGYVTSCAIVEQEGRIDLFHPCNVVGERFEASDGSIPSEGSSGFAIWRFVDVSAR